MYWIETETMENKEGVGVIVSRRKSGNEMKSHSGKFEIIIEEPKSRGVWDVGLIPNSSPLNEVDKLFDFEHSSRNFPYQK